ncbi:MAG: TlpA disulfide reductase family protein [Rhizobiaceae bacterium]
MSDGSKPRSASKFIASAVVAGLVAGAVAVYVSNRPSGNNGGDLAGACDGREALAKAVGEAATGDVAALMAAKPQSLGGLSFKGPDGSAMTLADLSGKTLLVNLWATWCAPCRAEMPAFDRLQAEMGGEAFEVVAINVEKGSDEKPKAFLDEIGVKHLAFYRDATLGVFNELKSRALVLGLPVTLVVDKDGCLLANMNGPAEWDGDDARRLIGTALGQ